MKEMLRKEEKLFEFVRTNLKETEEHPLITSRFILLFVESGEARVAVDAEEYRIGRQSFLFLHSLVEVRRVWASGDFRANIIYLDPGSSNPMMGVRIEPSFFMFALRQHCWQMSEDTAQAALHFCATLAYAIEDTGNPHYRDTVGALLSAFIYTFYHKTLKVYREERRAGELNAQSIFERFVQEVYNHGMEEHSVAFYADLLCITPKYLTQITKRLINHTPKELINGHLARASVVALRKSDMTIQEISNKLGFPDQSYFGRFFKRMHGVSPLYYRQHPNCLDKKTPE